MVTVTGSIARRVTITEGRRGEFCGEDRCVGRRRVVERRGGRWVEAGKQITFTSRAQRFSKTQKVM